MAAPRSKRARGRPKRSSFTDNLHPNTFPAAATLLRKLDTVDFGNFESQLQPIVNHGSLALAGGNNTATEAQLLRECMKFLVLKKIAGDEDATTLSPTSVIDSVWHQLLLNPRLYKNINDTLGGEMIDHDPEGGKDVEARKVRLARTLEMYKTFYIMNASDCLKYAWDETPVVVPQLLLAQPQSVTAPGKGIVIYVMDYASGQTMAFQIGKSTRVRMLAVACAKRIGMEVYDFRVSLNGDSLGEDQLLIDDIRVQEGDQLDIFRCQSGC